MDALAWWFDLSRQGATLVPSDAGSVPLWQQALLYGVVVAGVLLAESVAMARAGRAVSVDMSPPWVLTACVIALVVFPAVWRDIGSLPESSLLVQLGLAAQGGVFWGVLLAGAEKQVRGARPDPRP